jgi:hypothetical protein
MWIAGLAGVLGAGCATVRMPVPEPLAAAPEWVIRPRSAWRPDAALRVGPYEAYRIDRHGIRQRGGVMDVLKGKREFQQRYEFVLRDTAAARDLWSVRCDNRDVEQGVRLGGVELSLDDRSSLTCEIRESDQPAWTLRVGGSDDGAPTGHLRRGELAYDLAGTNPPGGTDDCCQPLGYVVRRGESVLASLETTDHGRLRLAPSVAPAEASLLAAASVALVLQTRLIDDP